MKIAEITIGGAKLKDIDCSFTELNQLLALSSSPTATPSVQKGEAPNAYIQSKAELGHKLYDLAHDALTWNNLSASDLYDKVLIAQSLWPASTLGSAFNNLSTFLKGKSFSTPAASVNIWAKLKTELSTEEIHRLHSIAAFLQRLHGRYIKGVHTKEGMLESFLQVPVEFHRGGPKAGSGTSTATTDGLVTGSPVSTPTRTRAKKSTATAKAALKKSFRPLHCESSDVLKEDLTSFALAALTVDPTDIEASEKLFKLALGVWTDPGKNRDWRLYRTISQFLCGQHYNKSYSDRWPDVWSDLMSLCEDAEIIRLHQLGQVANLEFRKLAPRAYVDAVDRN